MVKLRSKKRKTPHVAPDLSTKAGRKRARRELIWGDHGFLRANFSNLHQISNEMWRSNQPSPRQVLDHTQARGIRTIINLRGTSTKGYYLLEREAAERAGVELVDFKVFSRDTPTPETVLAAADLFDRIEYPALMHCKSGADRAGLMAALYKLLREEASVEEAAAQLSPKFLHMRQGKTGVLDAFLETFARYNEGRPEEEQMTFLDWVQGPYDREAVKAEFLQGLRGGIHWDTVLRRE